MIDEKFHFWFTVDPIVLKALNSNVKRNTPDLRNKLLYNVNSQNPCKIYHNRAYVSCTISSWNSHASPQILISKGGDRTAESHPIWQRKHPLFWHKWSGISMEMSPITMDGIWLHFTTVWGGFHPHQITPSQYSKALAASSSNMWVMGEWKIPRNILLWVFMMLLFWGWSMRMRFIADSTILKY